MTHALTDALKKLLEAGRKVGVRGLAEPDSVDETEADRNAGVQVPPPGQKTG
jgi:hypothetical protein